MKRPSVLRYALLFLLFYCGLGWAAAAVSSTSNTSNTLNTPSAQVLRQQLGAIALSLDEADDGRAQLAALQALGQNAAQAMDQHDRDLAALEQRLQGLGATPAASAGAGSGSGAAAAPVLEQRQPLQRQQQQLTEESQLLGLLLVEVQQRSSDLLRQRHALFRAAVSVRSATPLSPAFWHAVQGAAGDDGARLAALWQGLAQPAAQAWAAQRPALLAHVALALLLALLLPALVRRALRRWLPALAGAQPRLRAALWVALLVAANTLCAALVLLELFAALHPGAAGQTGGTLGALRAASVRAGAYAVFGASLGLLLLGRRLAPWPLLALSDAERQPLGALAARLALLSALSLWAGDVHSIAHLSRASEALLQALWAVLLLLVLAQGLHRLNRASATAAARPLWLAPLLALAGLVLLVSLLALLLGYVTLAQMLARQLVWVSVVAAAGYVLSVLIRELCAALLSSQGRWGASWALRLGVQARLLDQLAVLASALLHLGLWFYLLVALLAPLGSSPNELLGRGQELGAQLQIGELSVTPAALLTALWVLLGGFAALALLQRWLNQRYFPLTTLEPGLRHSIVTLLGYLGGVWVLALALAALGVSVERIAWVASALSVGIGFGLQAIVQNFISGLILLIERPIKVGDWVALGDTEGDVRRVNVRATEIQRSDRSTVLVPNSQFITQSVRNVTASNSPGSVSLRVPAPLDVDVLRMREVLLQCLQAHDQVLPEPAPAVTLEGVVDGTLVFVASGAVASPRLVSGVRSQLWFALLQALPAAGLRLAPPTRVTQQAWEGSAPGA